MKNIFAIILLLSGFAAHGQMSLKTDSVYITGKVANFEKFTNDANGISFIVDHIVYGTQQRYWAKLDADGNYRVAFLKTGTQDMMVLYGKTMFGLIVSPGDHLTVNFDAANVASTLSFSGRNAKACKDYNHYVGLMHEFHRSIYADEFAGSDILAKSEKGNQPDEHKKVVTDLYIKEKLFLTNYIEQYKPDPLVVKKATVSLKYEYLENLMRYRWQHPRRNNADPKDLVLPDNYFDFLNQADLNDPGLSISSAYRSFLVEYGNRLYEKELDPPYYFVQTLDLYFKQPPSFAKDVILCNTFHANIQQPTLGLIGDHMERFKTSVARKDFSDMIVKEFEDAVAKQSQPIKPINVGAAATEADAIFSKLISKYAGKVIYVDFWATWCGPCIAEMPNSKALQNKLSGKDVVFLNLCVQSEENTWKDMVNKLGITGENLLLSNNDFAALSAKFQIGGIPRYILVDKQGNVYRDNAQRPSDEGLLSDIEKLLAFK